MDSPGEFEKPIEFGEKHPFIKDMAIFIARTAPEYTKKILSAPGSGRAQKGYNEGPKNHKRLKQKSQKAPFPIL